MSIKFAIKKAILCMSLVGAVTVFSAQTFALPTEQLRTRALKGDRDAQFSLAVYYGSPRSVYFSETLAFEWMERAAKQGHEEARYRLGLSYFEGYGTQKDRPKGKLIIQTLADQDYVPAMYWIGKYYLENTNEASKELANPIALLEKASEQNYFLATQLLGHYYFEKEQYQRAFPYLTKSSKLGSAKSQYLLAQMYLNGLYVAKNLNEANALLEKSNQSGFSEAGIYLAESYMEQGKINKAVALLEALHQQKNYRATNHLAGLYQQGTVIKQDTQKAKDYYLIAAEGGFLPAIAAISNLQMMNDASPRSIKEGVVWLEKAARAGNIAAQRRLGARYLKGNGVEKNEKKGFYWISLAASSYDYRSLYLLGLMYQNGRGVPKDLKKAEEVFNESLKAARHEGSVSVVNQNREALANLYMNEMAKTERGLKILEKNAKEGSASSMVALSKLYSQGLVGQQNTKLAFYWANQAAQKNDPEGMYQLAIFYYEGLGLPQSDVQKSFDWMQKAAQPAYCFAKAQFMLGQYYKDGVGVKPNPSLAKLNFMRACENGFAAVCAQVDEGKPISYWDTKAE